jgi:LmbE family N-acetylglucosaminyl deacetylase
MLPLGLFARSSGVRRVLALGAHADDIEIGCGGTMLRLAAERPDLEVLWVVLSANDERAREAESSAAAFLSGFASHRLVVKRHRDGYLPWEGAAVKEGLEAVKREFSPDVVFTHFLEDRHQDHRLVADLTWNTWRNHLVLEYEIPKYDGDLGAPGVFAPLPTAVLERKIALVLEHFGSQARKHWLTADLLRALPRIRGMECVAPEGHAEAFYCRKAVL